LLDQKVIKKSRLKIKCLKTTLHSAKPCKLVHALKQCFGLQTAQACPRLWRGRFITFVLLRHLI